MKKVIGYIICESTMRPQTPTILKESSSTNGLTIVAVIQESDVKNRNGRIYPKNVIMEGLNSEYIKERIKTKTFYGEAGHPLKPDIQRQLYLDQNNISHIITNFWWEGALLKGNVEAALTNAGNNFSGLIRQGSKVAFSLRAVGPISENKGGVVIVKSPLTVFCYDWVIHPSHAPAYMQNIVSESVAPDGRHFAHTMNEASNVFIPLYEHVNLESYLRANSKHLKMISEQMELNIENSTYLSNDGKKIYVKGKEETVAIYTEDFIVREIDSYMSRICGRK